RHEPEHGVSRTVSQPVLFMLKANGSSPDRSRKESVKSAQRLKRPANAGRGNRNVLNRHDF
ncbi:hypothetical protein, partial [Arthrobacter sp. CAL618]|uniref:hypothetical protein n=1 Tax=Arthrobacter sp. CAL618 TaxID=1055770 RepID=UPI00055105DF